MTAQPERLGATNPLDPLVQDILANKNYLTPTHIALLRELLPEVVDTKVNGSFNLKTQIQKQLTILARIQTLALSSENIDEMKKVLSASKDLSLLISKLQSTIDSEARSQHIENAVVEALNEIGVDELKQAYLSILGKKLKKKS